MGQNFGNDSEVKWEVEWEVKCDAKLHPNYFSVNLKLSVFEICRQNTTAGTETFTEK